MLSGMAIGWARRDLLRAAGALLVAGACGAAGEAPTARPATTPGAARPSSPLAANASLGVWPDQIARAPAPVREAYDYAARRPASLRFIPCYCGCAGAGHRDNQDCYVKAFATDGWVVLDLHGYG
jgi:hypothetical protein